MTPEQFKQLRVLINEVQEKFRVTPFHYHDPNEVFPDEEDAFGEPVDLECIYERDNLFSYRASVANLRNYFDELRNNGFTPNEEELFNQIENWLRSPTIQRLSTSTINYLHSLPDGGVISFEEETYEYPVFENPNVLLDSINIRLEINELIYGMREDIATIQTDLQNIRNLASAGNIPRDQLGSVLDRLMDIRNYHAGTIGHTYNIDSQAVGIIREIISKYENIDPQIIQSLRFFIKHGGSGNSAPNYLSRLEEINSMLSNFSNAQSQSFQGAQPQAAPNEPLQNNENNEYKDGYSEFSNSEGFFTARTHISNQDDFSQLTDSTVALYEQEEAHNSINCLLKGLHDSNNTVEDTLEILHNIRVSKIPNAMLSDVLINIINIQHIPQTHIASVALRVIMIVIENHLDSITPIIRNTIVNFLGNGGANDPATAYSAQVGALLEFLAPVVIAEPIENQQNTNNDELDGDIDLRYLHNIQYDNQNIYYNNKLIPNNINDINPLNLMTHDTEKLLSNFAVNYQAFNKEGSDLLMSIIVAPSELEFFTIEQLSSVLGKIYTWFSES